MATETAEGTESAEEVGEDVERGDSVSPYMRGVIVTTVATLSGLAAALASAIWASGPGDPIALLYLFLLVVVQFPAYQGLGIDTGAFGTKDKLYVTFMTFVLWFVGWTILMTAGTFN